MRSRIFKNCFVILAAALAVAACEGDTIYILKCPDGTDLENHPPEIHALSYTSIIFGDTLRLAVRACQGA